MLPPEPEPTDPEAVADEEPPTILRRRIPAAAAAEPRGAITPGRDVEEEVEDCDCDEPLGPETYKARPFRRLFSTLLTFQLLPLVFSLSSSISKILSI